MVTIASRTQAIVMEEDGNAYRIELLCRYGRVGKVLGSSHVDTVQHFTETYLTRCDEITNIQ
jgi:hypothetical protein